MQSENFDNKIRDLLDQPPRGNENPDWERMESLLDKHLPQKKNDRKRFVIFLVFFLLLGGSSFLIWNSERKTPNKIVSENSELIPVNEKIAKDVKQNQIEENNNDLKTNSDQQPIKVTGESIPIQNNPGNNKIVTDPGTASNNKLTNSFSNLSTRKKQASQKNKKIVDQSTGVADSEFLTKNENDKANNTVVEENNPTTSSSINLNEIDLLHDQTDNPNEIIKENLTEDVSLFTIPRVQKDIKPKKSFLNNLFFSLSAGPDISAVGFGNAGQVKLSRGVGIGYQFSNRLSVRTGFYTARKVYTADPEDYNPPSNFWTYYPNLKTIDANCKVYEIPVLMDYSFKPGKKGNWFVSGGASTLLMKEETYEYYFKPNYSPNYVTYSKTYKNQNKHYFSIVDLSGGYRWYFNKKFSLQAEPYLKIATSGVGFGKVNLNSGGLMISAIVKPFARK